MADLIVDEGQDLALGFFRIVRSVAKNITVFADENQQLFDNNTTLHKEATPDASSRAHWFGERTRTLSCRLLRQRAL